MFDQNLEREAQGGFFFSNRAALSSLRLPEGYVPLDFWNPNLSDPTVVSKVALEMIEGVNVSLFDWDFYEPLDRTESSRLHHLKLALEAPGWVDCLYDQSRDGIPATFLKDPRTYVHFHGIQVTGILDPNGTFYCLTYGLGFFSRTSWRRSPPLYIVE